MSPDLSSYEILAATCHDLNCPTLVRDPATGRLGVLGYVRASCDGDEAIVWMSPEQWALLSGA